MLRRRASEVGKIVFSVLRPVVSFTSVAPASAFARMTRIPIALGWYCRPERLDDLRRATGNTEGPDPGPLLPLHGIPR